MIRKTVAAALLSLTAVSAVHAAEPSAPAGTHAATPKYTTADTDIGTLLDDPAAKAILAKHLPQIAGNAQIEQARSMTLKQIQSYTGGAVTDEALAKVDADLAKLPVAK